jgi:NAD(P) transhydrogenase subunit alpha
MDLQNLTTHSHKILQSARELLENAKELDAVTKNIIQQTDGGYMSPFMVGLIVFILACFVGYYVVWKVTPALHSPLMAVTNAISSVIIVGALIAAGPAISSMATSFGFLAVVLASVNIFGGFIVTQRMLQMFAKSK